MRGPVIAWMEKRFILFINSARVSVWLKLDLETSMTSILTETGMDESPSVAPNGAMVIYDASERKRNSGCGRCEFRIQIFFARAIWRCGESLRGLLISNGDGF